MYCRVVLAFSCRHTNKCKWGVGAFVCHHRPSDGAEAAELASTDKGSSCKAVPQGAGS